MIRLVDYFAVVGYDDSSTIGHHKALTEQSNDYSLHDEQLQCVSSNRGKAKIIQRFPNNMQKQTTEMRSIDEPEFDTNIHCFCQPHKGWSLYKKQEAPTFFVSVLTDIKGQRRYLACLTFLEPYMPHKMNVPTAANGNGHNNMEDMEDNLEDLDSMMLDEQIMVHKNGKKLNSGQPIEPCKLYAAKSLVLISRLEYTDLFKSILSLIYAAYVDKRHSLDNKLLEIIIANLLTVNVNAPGTALATTFTLGADDRHMVQATASLTVPATGSSVYKLFNEIGIVNVFKLVCAVLADFKVLFFSRSYTKLYEACRALEALLFPLKYTGVYVPVLPCFGSFLEFPSAPTPYIIGIHSSFRRLIEQMHCDSLQECIKVDLDGACVSIPQCVDDLIMGSPDQISSSSSHSNKTNTASSTTSTSSSSGVSSSYLSTSPHEYNAATDTFLNESCSTGIPHCLYESTINLLFSILKPDVLKADEMSEFLLSSSSSTHKGHFSKNNETIGDTNCNGIECVNSESSFSPLQFVSQSNESAQHQQPSPTTNSFESNQSSLLLTTNVNQMAPSEIETIWLDKLLRAVFVRLFAQLFAGYRYCLIIIRINPKPVICFNKANFLSNHCLSSNENNEFMNRLLDSMSFQHFIEERGPSYRHCDVFDDLYAEIQSQLRDELEQQIELSYSNSLSSSNSLTMKHLKQIAEKLYKYEFPQTSVLTTSVATSSNSSLSSASSGANSVSSNGSSSLINKLKSSVHSSQIAKDQSLLTPVTSNGTVNLIANQSWASSTNFGNGLLTTPNRSYSKIKLPTPDAFKRLHSETFPFLDSNEIHRLIKQHQQHQLVKQQDNQMPKNHLCRPHLVPYGPPIETVKNMSIINKHLISLNESNYYKISSWSLNNKISNRLTYGELSSSSFSSCSNQNSDTKSANNTRKLEAIAQCIQHIFDNNFKEAKKNLNSAYRALRDHSARIHLCVCLQKYVKRNQVILNNEQFDYVCKLLNEALANDASSLHRLDEHGVAYSILPLTSAFYRKLNNNTVDQCIYTKLQQHDVWSSMQFWEMAFFCDVQRSIRPVYLSNEEFAAEQEKENNSGLNSNGHNGEALTASNSNDDILMLNGQTDKLSKRPTNLILSTTTTSNNLTKKQHLNGKHHLNIPELNLNLYSRPAEKTALEICGEQMEKYGQLSDEQRENFIRNEQGIIRSHVLHYITQMVNMKIPLDVNIKIAAEEASQLGVVEEMAPTESYHHQQQLHESHNNDQSKLESNQSSAATTPRSQSIEFEPASNSPATNENNPSLNKSIQSSQKLSFSNSKSLQGKKPFVSLANTVSDNDSGYDALVNNLNNKQKLDNLLNEGSMSNNAYTSNNNAEFITPFGIGEIGTSVWKFVKKFVDRVCVEGNLADTQRQALHSNLSEVISMQIQMLETVYTESKRVPLRSKPKFEQLKPDYMLPGEHFVDPTPLRCHLVPDGREEVCGMSGNGGSVLIPAEGALFLTNYRIIYRGMPINDSLMSDSIITRSFPVSALIKEKKIGNTFKFQSNNMNNDLSMSIGNLHDGLQMRSSTFQLIKIYFDEEVNSEKIDRFRSALLKIRYPQSVLEFFCFNNSQFDKYRQDLFMQQTVNNPSNYSNGSATSLSYGNNINGNSSATVTSINIIKTKEKHTDAIRHFAKNTLRKAGLMPRNSNRKLPPQSSMIMKSNLKTHLNGNQQTAAQRTPETARKALKNQEPSPLSNSKQEQMDSDEDCDEEDEIDEECDDDHEETENLSINEDNLHQDVLTGGRIGANLISNLVLNDPNLKNLEKLIEASPFVFKDYFRQGFLVSQSIIMESNDYDDSTDDATSASSASFAQNFRLCTLNINYQLCKSYPSLFLVPKDTSDECIRRNSKCHRQNRLPIIVWHHPTKRALLLRSSGFHTKGFIGMLMKSHHHSHQNSNTANETTNNIEQDKYINEIIRLTTKSTNYMEILNSSSNTASNNVLNTYNTNQANKSNNASTNSTNAHSVTPNTNRRNLFTSKLDKAVKTIKNNYNLTYNNSWNNSSSQNNGYASNNNSFNNGNNKFNTLASLSLSSNSNNPKYLGTRLAQNNADYTDTNSTNNQTDPFNESFSSSINSNHPYNHQRRGAPLYIICEKSQLKSFRSEIALGSKDQSTANKYVFLPVDVHEVKDTKNSFKKLCRACVPSASASNVSDAKDFMNEGNENKSDNKHYSTNGTTNKFGISKLTGGSSKINRKKSGSINSTAHLNPNNMTTSNNGTCNSGFFKQIHDSKWFDQLQTIISVTNLIIDRIEDASSVMVCLEDGWDFTTQVVSLAELLLDPYYRTIEGFGVLIEREWLANGHRFSRRSNHTIDDQTGFAPIFLQFLDAVYQCYHQFPNAFEFNEFYLEFLAYHYVSNRFKTFVLDSELERTQFGIVNTNWTNAFFDLSAIRNHTSLHTNVSCSMASAIPTNTTCIWQYILKCHYSTPKFFNFNYQPNMWHTIRPSSDLYKLKLWRYYTRESLCTGPIYDLDLIKLFGFNQQQQQLNAATSSNSTSKLTSNSAATSNALATCVDECWYPVSINNAQDYYEQLDQILPSQYEILIKQIIIKYKLSENLGMAQTPSSQTSPQTLASSSVLHQQHEANQFLSKLLNVNSIVNNTSSATSLSSGTEPKIVQNVSINWKNVWDYFYQTVESRMIKEFLLMTSNNADNGKKSVHQPQQQHQHIQAKTPQTTPPFPKIQHIYNQANGDGQSKHDFELFIFSSVNCCNLCGGSFKSNTNFIGLKCISCALICHEQCLNNYEEFPTECCGVLTNHDAHQTKKNLLLVNNNNMNTLAHLDISSSYSVQTTSSSSTTPNSHYSHSTTSNHTNGNQLLLNKYGIGNNVTKLDTDIGSACAGNVHGTDYNGKPNPLVDRTNGCKSFGYIDENGGPSRMEPPTIPVPASLTSSYSITDANGSILQPNSRNFINWSLHTTSNNSEHQTYAGYLKKQGALFKQWKERYFVLDSVKHQLRYYDSSNDTVVKGLIDLSDVESINQGLSSSYLQQQLQVTNGSANQYSTTKKAINNFINGSDSSSSSNDAKSCFELKTSKRVYYFCAKSPQEAFKWVKQLEMCCMDS